MDGLITAVITTYKRDAATVRRSASSVLSQDHRPLELILVDDNRDDDEGRAYSGGISDLACELSKRAGDIQVRYVRTEDGKHGAQAARNTGVHQGKGEYFAFLDDDDEWLPGKLTAQLKCLKEHEGAGLCYCRGIKVDMAYDPPYESDYHGGGFKSEADYRELLRGDCIGTTSQAMIPAEVFERVGGFDEKLPARQDYEMWVRITSAFRAVGVDKPLFRYYKNGEGTQISRNWDRCIEGHRLLYEKYRKDIDSDRAARFNVIFYLAHYHMCKGDRAAMIGYYVRAFFISPPEFWKKGMIKLSAMKKDRELKKGS